MRGRLVLKEPSSGVHLTPQSCSLASRSMGWGLVFHWLMGGWRSRSRNENISLTMSHPPDEAACHQKHGFQNAPVAGVSSHSEGQGIRGVSQRRAPCPEGLSPFSAGLVATPRRSRSTVFLNRFFFPYLCKQFSPLAETCVYDPPVGDGGARSHVLEGVCKLLRAGRPGRGGPLRL